MDRKLNANLPPAHRRAKTVKRTVIRQLIGLLVLLAVASLGRVTKTTFHLTLPSPVISLALLTMGVLLVKRFHNGSNRQLALRLVPVSRLLIAHMGLLFVPAGVGIMTEGDILGREWRAIAAALFGSSLIGIMITGWIMQRFASRVTHSEYESSQS